MTKASLSPQRRVLVEEMSRLNFGRIEELQVQNGDPVFARARIIREHTLGGQRGARPERPDFTLCAEVVELFEIFSKIDIGIIRCLQVRHALPVLLEIEDSKPTELSSVGADTPVGDGHFR